MQVCEFQKRAALNVKILILKSKYYQFIKKRGVKHLRTIPISNRLYQAIGEYLKTNDISIESNSFFPSKLLLSVIFRENNVGSTKPD
jgi:hypothetical protein